jgi:hypothetical protein
MAIAGQYLEVVSEIAFDSGRLGRRFYDQQLYDTLPRLTLILVVAIAFASIGLANTQPRLP